MPKSGETAAVERTAGLFIHIDGMAWPFGYDRQGLRRRIPKAKPDIKRRDELLLQILASKDPPALAQPQPAAHKMGALGKEVRTMGSNQLFTHEMERKQAVVFPLAIGASVKNIKFVMESVEPYEGRLSRTVR